MDDSERLLSNASNLLETSIGKLKDLQDAPDTLEKFNNNFDNQLNNNRKEIDDIYVLKPKVQEHASNLSERVQQLEHILSESQFGSADAVKAARAYRDIVASVKNAREAADSAQNDTNEAVDILNNIQDRTNDAEFRSANALADAHERNQTTHEKLAPKLHEAIATYIPLKKTHDRNADLLQDIEKILQNIQIKDLDKAYKNASDNADGALNTISEIEQVVNNSFNEVSGNK